MTKTVLLLIMLLGTFCGCGRERLCGLNQENTPGVSVEEVSAIAQGLADETPETFPIVYGIGGQLLRAAYDDYRSRGLGAEEIERLPKTPFSDNLARLYRDLESVAE